MNSAFSTNTPNANACPVAASGFPSAGRFKLHDGGVLETFLYPHAAARSREIGVTVNGHPVFVLRTDRGAVATFAASGQVQVKVAFIGPVDPVSSAILRPLNRGIEAVLGDEKRSASFTLPGPCNMLLELGNVPVHIFCVPVEDAASRPDPAAEGVHYFRAGQIYEVGELRLQDGETLYIEGGAIVLGCVRANKADNIRIAGAGIIDGRYYSLQGTRTQTVFLDGCKGVTLESYTIVNPTSWQNKLMECSAVTIRNLHLLGSGGGSDGIDIVSCQDVTIEDCYVDCGDDCIVVKAVRLGPDREALPVQDVRNVRVRRCVLMNDCGGTIMEIGHELLAEKVHDIEFSDCDVLHVHGYGSVFGIHHTGPALVTDIQWRDIRVEHYYHRLISLRVMDSMWSHTDRRGQVRSVEIRDVDVSRTIFNPGYSVSLIGGWNKDHTVENVLLENIRYDGQPLQSIDDLEIFTSHAKNIRFVR